MARKLSVREGTLLVALAVAGVGYLWLSSRPEEGKHAAVARRGGASKAKAKGEGSRPPTVRVDLLAARAEAYDANGRDLFKYSQRPPSAEEVRRSREEAARRQKEMEEANQRAALAAARWQQEEKERVKEAVLHPQPPPPPAPPPIDLRYLGYLGPKDDRIAVFEDGKNLLVARKGEVVKDQFRVVEVKWETVVLGFVRAEFKGQTRELAMVKSR